MIGLDTNILARYFLDDDPQWSPQVATFFDARLFSARPGYVSPITLVELVWILRRKPGYDRLKLSVLIESLLASERIVLGEAKAVERALAAFRIGSAGFAGYLIAEPNEAAGASATKTRDRKAVQNPPFIPFSQEA